LLRDRYEIETKSAGTEKPSGGIVNRNNTAAPVPATAAEILEQDKKKLVGSCLEMGKTPTARSPETEKCAGEMQLLRSTRRRTTADVQYQPVSLQRFIRY